jgi:hypothetical protein
MPRRRRSGIEPPGEGRRDGRGRRQDDLVYKPDRNRAHPPIDKRVKTPRQVRHGAERAEDLIEGNPPREVVQAGQMAGRA